MFMNFQISFISNNFTKNVHDFLKIIRAIENGPWRFFGFCLSEMFKFKMLSFEKCLDLKIFTNHFFEFVKKIVNFFEIRDILNSWTIFKFINHFQIHERIFKLLKKN